MQAPEFFFTDLDESRRPKGSRDPLGLEPIWSQVGRRLVGNLTTVTRSLDNFIVTLVGFAVAANAHSPSHAIEAGSAEFYLRFERFEQLAAWARFAGKQPDVIGTRIIAERNQARNGGTVEVGPGPAARILGDQRRSGLWGLYSSALMGTGLVDTKRALTPEGRRLVEPFLQCYRSSKLETFRNHMEDRRRTIQVLPEEIDLHAVLHGSGRLALAERLLRDGGGQMQQAIYRFAHTEVFAGVKGPQDLFAALAAYKGSPDPALPAYAQTVIELERMLVVVAGAFDFLLGPQPRLLDDVAALFISKGWGDSKVWSSLSSIEPQFRAKFTDVWRQRVDKLCEAVGHLTGGGIPEFIRGLLAFHADVMKDRGGPAWVSLDAHGSIRGIMGEMRALPRPQELLPSWNNDYFVGAFVALTGGLGMKPESTT
ncbi:hypothetical protein [Trinickia soli]|uniref:hypothetical protein n=1 Tax=Trinickia soli TaxID=380675 RepID=UPI003FA3A58A